ncbi:MAG: ROK family protein [Oscillospiraceae bacterium]|nr:ROK family protein [Oscillospiraceae bacterium]
MGLDCGVTEIRGIVCNQDGKVLNTARMAAESGEGFFKYIHNIQSLVNTLAQPYSEISCVGVASTGRIDPQNGIVLNSTIPGYTGINLRVVVSSVLDVDVVVQNSDRAALIGESWMGAAKGYKDVVLLTLGTIVGGATMIDGNIHHGSSFRAGEWGHMQLIPNGKPCSCGRTGCLEQYIATSILSEQMERVLGLNACREEYHELYPGENENIAAVLGEFTGHLAWAVGNIEATADPELVLIGGESFEWFDIFSPLLSGELAKRNIRLPVKKILLGSDSGCIGAVKLALENCQCTKNKNK